MARRLIVVEDAFLIKGRGIVPVPGFVPEGEERVRVGDPITLRRPDGSSLAWRIGGIEMIHGSVPRDDLPLLLKGLGKDDVPIGTEIWSSDSSCSTARDLAGARGGWGRVDPSRSSNGLGRPGSG